MRRSDDYNECGWQVGSLIAAAFAFDSFPMENMLAMQRRPGGTTMNDAVRTRELHIVQGGVKNGDKRWLEGAARNRGIVSHWVVPKRVTIGDEVVIYIRSHGLYATGRVVSNPRPRPDWPNRYGARIGYVRLIDPPISLEILRRRLPALEWATYPRSITTPAFRVAQHLRGVIRDRRLNRGSEISSRALNRASLAELRALALARSLPRATAQEQVVLQRKRSAAIKAYALARAGGKCEFCGEEGPFLTQAGEPYLESHHILRMSDGGPDHPRNVIGVCPNCHRCAHHSRDRSKVRTRMKRRVASLEKRRTDVQGRR